MQLSIVRQTPVASILLMLLLVSVAFVRFATAPYGDELVVGGLATFGEWVDSFQSASPIWGWVLSAVVVMLSSVMVGRMATSFGLYRTRTTISIPLYAVVACGIFISTNSLATALAAYSVVLLMRYLCGGSMRGADLNFAFYAGVCAGVATMLYAPSVLFVLLLPVAIVMFGLAWREVVVMFAGLLLPVAANCYIGWLCGADFLAPVEVLFESIALSSGYLPWRSESVVALLMMGLLSFAVVCGVATFVGDTRSVAIRPRTIFVFNIVALALAIAAFAMPSATVGVYMLVAAPAALLIPFLLLHLRDRVADLIIILFLILMVVHFFIA